MRNGILDFSCTTFSIVKMFPHVKNFLRYAVFEVVLQAHLKIELGFSFGGTNQLKNRIPVG